MLINWLIPQIHEDSDEFTFHQLQNGAPPRFHYEVVWCLNNNLPEKWMGLGMEKNEMLCTWSLRLQDPTPYNLFCRFTWSLVCLYQQCQQPFHIYRVVSLKQSHNLPETWDMLVEFWINWTIELTSAAYPILYMLRGKHNLPVLAGFEVLLRPWRWMRPAPPKCRLTFSRLHDVIS
jgi:hypothetical protein